VDVIGEQADVGGIVDLRELVVQPICDQVRAARTEQGARKLALLS
jgi:hypothetical protein